MDTPMMCVKYFFEGCTDYNVLSYLPDTYGTMFVDIIQCILGVKPKML